jgi:hypothetical protein
MEAFQFLKQSVLLIVITDSIENQIAMFYPYFRNLSASISILVGAQRTCQNTPCHNPKRLPYAFYRVAPLNKITALPQSFGQWITQSRVADAKPGSRVFQGAMF